MTTSWFRLFLTYLNQAQNVHVVHYFISYLKVEMESSLILNNIQNELIGFVKVSWNFILVNLMWLVDDSGHGVAGLCYYADIGWERWKVFVPVAPKVQFAKSSTQHCPVNTLAEWNMFLWVIITIMCLIKTTKARSFIHTFAICPHWWKDSKAKCINQQLIEI